MKTLFIAIIGIFLASFTNFGWAQQTNYVDEEARNKRVAAYDNIQLIKNGALLVRLSDRKKSLAAYKRAGDHAIAKRIEAELLKDNLRLMDLFTTYFDFCPVYFFYSSDSKAVCSGNANGLLLNAQLERDPSIVIQQDTFFIAELGVLKDEDKIEDDNTYNPTTLQRVFIIKDRFNKQLASPLPFYQRIIFDRYWPRLITKWNERLHKFYNSSIK